MCSRCRLRTQGLIARSPGSINPGASADDDLPAQDFRAPIPFHKRSMKRSTWRSLPPGFSRVRKGAPSKPRVRHGALALTMIGPEAGKA